MVASVPDDTRRKRSTLGTILAISSAMRISASVGAPNDKPSIAASRTASTTSGCACPTMPVPHEPTKSMYCVPFSSHTNGPCARRIKRGVPPTLPKARTGELTPAGIIFLARSNKVSLQFMMYGFLIWLMEKVNFNGFAVRKKAACTKKGSAGCFLR